MTQSLLRHSNISSTMKYTEASNEDLQAAVRGLDWGQVTHQPEPAEIGTGVPDLDAMSTKQLAGLTEQLLAALAKRQPGTR